jgi:predicted small metal-binding protein
MGLKCLFAVDGETVEEVTKKALAHIIEQHTNDFNIIESPEEILRMEKALARSTRVVPG